jgi:hypothetical protein
MAGYIEANMTPYKLLKELKRCAKTNDLERSHMRTDKRLCEALLDCNPEFIEAIEYFKNMDKWYA